MKKIGKKSELWEGLSGKHESANPPLTLCVPPDLVCLAKLGSAPGLIQGAKQ